MAAARLRQQDLYIFQCTADTRPEDLLITPVLGENGSIVYRVRNPEMGREWQVGPMRYLTWRQANEMTGQPDLILQLAHRIADDFRQRGRGPVEVRVDALVSLNGRPAARLIDPDVDLARVDDGLAPADWILPAEASPPFQVARRPH